MNSSTLIELFGQLIFSFTRGVAENYNPDEPEFTTESLGYDPLECTGREWNYLPVDELIYQEYSDMEGSNLNYMAANSLRIRVINACSPEENEVVYDEQYGEDRAMAWKRLRPSALRTVGKSMYVGALISLLTASMIGSLYMLITYLIYKFGIVCEFQKSIPIQVQWLRTGSVIITCAFAYMWYFANILSLFRPHQLNGVKRKLILVCGCNLLYNFTSLWNISLTVFYATKDPSRRIVFRKCMLADLFLNKPFADTKIQKTTGYYFHANDSAHPIYFYSQCDDDISRFSSVQ